MFGLQLLSLGSCVFAVFAVIKRSPQRFQNLSLTLTYGLLTDSKPGCNFRLGEPLPEQSLQQVPVLIRQARECLLEVLLLLLDMKTIIGAHHGRVLYRNQPVPDRIRPLLTITRERARQDLMVNKAVQTRPTPRIKDPNCMARRRNTLGIDFFPPVRKRPPRRNPPTVSTARARRPYIRPILHMVLQPAVHRLRKSTRYMIRLSHCRAIRNRVLAFIHDSCHASIKYVHANCDQGEMRNLSRRQALLKPTSDR